MTSKLRNSFQFHNENFSEERTSSTHALTMYRHNTIVDGKEYKVGKSIHLFDLFT